MVFSMLSLARSTSIMLPLLLSLQVQSVIGATHNFHNSVSIPADLTPDDVIAALHDHNNILSLQAFTTGHTDGPTPDPATLQDPYWNPIDKYPVKEYMATECIPVIPGIGDLGKPCFTFPALFQSTDQGLKTSGDAPAGITVHAEFSVVKASDTSADNGPSKRVDSDWMLVEDVVLTANTLLMPFVAPKMEDAHKDICQKLINKVKGAKNGTSTGKRSVGGRRLKRGSLGTNIARTSNQEDNQE